MAEKIKLIFVPCQENNYRPKFLAGDILFYYLILILILKLSLLPFFLYFPKSIFFAEITKSALIQLTNQAREALNLPLLKENSKLNQAAFLKAKDMLEKDYFSHQSPEGILAWDWLKRVGYNYQRAGENLAIGFLESEQVHSAWMDSPLHKNNILNPNYQEIGLAVLKGEFERNETTVVVQLFGSPRAISKKEVFAKEIEKAETEIPEEPLEVPSPTVGETEILSAEPSFQSEAPSSGEILIPTNEEEIISQAPAEEIEKNLTFHFLKFMIFHYHNLVQKFIYGSLILVILSLVITVFCDIFVYRKFEIQHKDIVLKTIGFSILLLALLYLDKEKIIDFITFQTFRIY